MKRLKTAWDEHYLFPAFLDFMRFAMADEDIVEQFRRETGNRYEPPRSNFEAMIDAATGADFDFLQSFSDFCERSHFGTPADLENA